MFCQKCGNQMPEDVGFCQKCGENVIGDKSVKQAVGDREGVPRQFAPDEHVLNKQFNAQPQSQQVREKQIQTDRSLGKLILLSIVTIGIYGIVFWYGIAKDVNEIASKYDGERTMNYVAVFFLSPFTLFILPLVWTIKISNRIGGELKRRNVDDSFSASVVLWIFLPIVGAFIFAHKFITAMNKLAENYIING